MSEKGDEPPPAKFAQYEKVLCFHGTVLYEGKVLKIEYREDQKEFAYWIHYLGWSKTWDEWIDEKRVLKYCDENLEKQKELQVAHAESLKVVKSSGGKVGRNSLDKTSVTGKGNAAASISGKLKVVASVSGKKKVAARVSGKGKSVARVSGKVKASTSVAGKGKAATSVTGKGNKATRVTGEGNEATSVTGEGNEATSVTGEGNEATSVTGEGNEATCVTGELNEAACITGNRNAAASVSSIGKVAAKVSRKGKAVASVSGEENAAFSVSGEENAAFSVSGERNPAATKSIAPRKRGRKSKVKVTIEPAVESEVDLQRKAECVETTSHYKAKQEVHIMIPDKLKLFLSDDWDHITRLKKLVLLPAKITVEDILGEYLEEKGNQDQDAVEFCDGLRDYFNTLLGSQLLYRFERLQFENLLKELATQDERERKKLHEVYGAPHLMRLFTKLGGCIAFTNLDAEATDLLLKIINNFFEFMLKNFDRYFSPECYGITAPEYQRVKTLVYSF